MGIYEQLLVRPDVFYQEYGLKPESLFNVRALLIRTGTRKGQFLSEFLRPFCVPTLVNPPDWDEDLVKNRFIPPQKKAALKTLDTFLDMREIAKEKIQLSNGYVLSIATDVEQLKGETNLNRPLGVLSESEIIEQIMEVLGGDSVNQFIVQSSSTVYGKDLEQDKDSGMGIIVTEEHKICASPFTNNEIVQYVQEVGLEGIRRSSLGIRWPHPLFDGRIITIDGIHRDNPGYEQAKIKLYLALLGTPEGLFDLIEYFDENLHLLRGASLYSNLPGIWSEIVKLKTREQLLIQTASPVDYKEMSEIAEMNFRHAPTYAYLTVDERERFIAANSPEGIAQLCQHPDNICVIVVKNREQKVVGFRVVRADWQRGVANGRRLHVALNMQNSGLGKKLLQLSEQITTERGLRQMEVHATGTSAEWFAKMGYQPIEVVSNSDGVFVDKPLSYVLMVKEL